MRRVTVRHMCSSLLLALGIVVCSCASVLSPVAPEVTADACQKITSCGECISNTACGWCGSCMAATSADTRETAPKTCSGTWVWQLGTCPDAPTAEAPSAITEL